LQDKSVEIGNVQNQLHSTNRALETSKREREDLEKRVAEQSAQLTALQTQLTSAKASYETETRLLATLRERFSAQTVEIQNTRQELIRAESDLSASRVERDEVQGSLLRDKDEVRELQRKMAEIGAEVESTKAQVEKLKKEAKQQKGMLAIAKKQLASREAERAKIAKELEDIHADTEATMKELQETEHELANAPAAVQSPKRVASPSGDSITTFAAAQPLPASPEPILASPTSMTGGKSTNPFERLSMGGTGSPRAQSPFLPFTSSAVLPTPTTGAQPTLPPVEQPAIDPFGFEDVFGPETGQADGRPIADGSQPAVSDNGPPFGAQATGVDTDILSPTDTDHFVTPPTTATFPVSTSAADTDRTTSPGPAVASPAVETSIPEHFAPATANQEGKHEDTDLNAQLKELDVEESDSDSDDDEPLTNVKAKLRDTTPPSIQPASGQPSASAFDDSFGTSSTLAPASTASTSSGSTVPSDSTISAETSKVAVAATSPSPFVSAPSAPENVTSTNSESSGAAGVSDFDEAFGKLSGGSGTDASGFSHVSQFTFDDTFEDDFDFAAAKAAVGPETTPQAPSVVSAPPPTSALTPAVATSTPFPPPPVQTPRNDDFDTVFLPQASSSFTPQPTAPAITSTSTPFSFDDAFGETGPSSDTPAAAALQQVPTGESHGISFDDAFGGHSSELTNNTSHQQSSSDASHPTSQTSTPFPTSIPSSPTRETGSINSRRSTSPSPREMSPPPRVSSKSRPSTASSENAKSTRHSKLSVSSSSIQGAKQGC
jgi:epidermal growth factor receptor substrate 15